MTVVNLRKYYWPLITKDTFMEVPDDVAEALVLGNREGRREDGRKYQNGVLSLDANIALENHVTFPVLSPEQEMILEEERIAHELLLEHLQEALTQLTPTQARRLHARYVLKKKFRQIGADEGVSGNCAMESVNGAIRKLQKIFKKNGWMK